MNEPVTFEDGPAVEVSLGKSMFFAALTISPLLILGSYFISGVHGAESAGYAVILVLINFAVAAKMLAYAARISPVALMVAALSSFFFDLLLLTAATLPVARARWMDLADFGVVLIVSHLVSVVFVARRVTGKITGGGIRPGWRRN